MKQNIKHFTVLANWIVLIAAFWSLEVVSPSGRVSAQDSSNIDTADHFDDAPLQAPLVLPDWFKVSFLELADDLQEALDAGKKGIIIYFGQKHCAYCKAQLENNWGQKDILHYTQKYFDVIAIDIRSQRQVTDFDGTTMSEKEYAIRHRTNFTPSLLFYVRGGKQALKLRGYRPPYQFRAALEYVADDHYLKEAFDLYLARAESAFSYGKDSLNQHPQFMPPPYALDRSHFAAERPLLVAFERPNCHACDILHGGPLEDPRINALLKQLDMVQINIRSDTPVITPVGKHTSAKKWAQELKLDYTPTLMFFDQHGKEIIRIDSVVWFYRLRNVLDYVNSGDYRRFPTFQAWRQNRNR